MAKRFKYRAGLTLIEIMVATAIFVIAVLGTSGFRYHANLGAREADSKLTAARIALLLCESWRGASDPSIFEPSALASAGTISALVIEPHYVSYEVPSDSTLLGACRITANGVDYYYAVLSWKDVSPGLRALNVVVAWDPRSSSPDYHWNGGGRSFKLTTYVGS
jgi:prepilin-type N-terminal cleavage/methylation domain-containing protein